MDLANLIAELEEETTIEAVRDALDEGVEPLTLLEGLRDGMSIVGKRFEQKEYYLSELMLSAEIFQDAMGIIEPYLKSGEGNPKGSIVLGTVKGDVHDIGKNIVSSLLKCEGYEVHDLGVDVEPEMFVKKLRETGAGLLGMSGLLTLAFESMKETIDYIREVGLRDEVKIVIGGGPVDQSVVKYSGADAFGADAADAVRLANSYLGDET